MSAHETDPDVEYPHIARRFLDAGVVVPADRAAGAYAAAQRLLEAVHWLRRPRDAAAEPAHVFRLAPTEEALP